MRQPKLKSVNYKMLNIVLLAGLLIFWGGFFTYKWADKQLKAHASKTSVILYQLSSDLQNLPQPKLIKAGQTSGHATSVILKYRQTEDNLRWQSERLGLPLLPRVVLFWDARKLNDLNIETAKTLINIADELGVITDALEATKKFIEYAPVADLSGIDKPDSDASERIERTQNGLKKTAADLKATKYDQRQKLANALEPIIQQVPALTDATLPAWSKQIEAEQNAYVESFQTSWTGLRQKTPDLLRNLAESLSYQ